MNTYCICGGRYRRSDLVAVYIEGRWCYKDLWGHVAYWRCDKCGQIRSQGKRQPNVRKAVEGDL